MVFLRPLLLFMACLASTSTGALAFLSPSISPLRGKAGSFSAERSSQRSILSGQYMAPRLRKGPGILMSAPPKLDGEVFGKERLEQEEQVERPH
jgi:hypothetical protein